jgi:hypothetical protein
MAEAVVRSCRGATRTGRCSCRHMQPLNGDPRPDLPHLSTPKDAYNALPTLPFCGNHGSRRREVLAATPEFVTSLIVCRRRADSASDGVPAVMSLLVVDDDPVGRTTVMLVPEWAKYSAGDGPNKTMNALRDLQPTIPVPAPSGRRARRNRGSEPDFPIMVPNLVAVPGPRKPFKPATRPAPVVECLAAVAKPSDSRPNSDVASRR